MFRSIKWFLHFMMRYEKKYILPDVCAVLLASVLAPVSVLYLERFIDEISRSGAFMAEFYIYAGILVIREGIRIARRFLAAGMYYDMGVSIPGETAQKFRRLPYFLFEKSESRDILEQITEKPFEALYELYLQLTLILSDIVSAALYLLVIGQVHPALSAGYFFFLLCNVKISFDAMKFMTDLYNEQTREERQMNYLSGLLGDKNALTELKVFRSVPYILRLWRNLAKIVLGKRLKTTMRSQLGYGISGLLGVVWMGVLLFFMIWQLTAGKIAIGTFIGILNCSAALIALSESLANHGVLVSRQIAAAEQYQMFGGLAEQEEKEDGASEEKEGSGIVFQEVTFAYPNSDKKVLNGLSFQIKPGEIAALVGENGAGKSTVIKLLCNLYPPVSGKILIDGKEPGRISGEELSRLIGVAFQDFERYSLTLRENVALGKTQDMEKEEAVREALSKAGVREPGLNLEQPLGHVEENGMDLSGGQWQRIAIARALFGDKNYIILDEPTAAIDPVAESEMYQSFRQAMKGKTGLVISHRLASAAFADRILVIEKGRIAETGTHQELLEKGGLYAHMWEVQSAWYEEGKE